MTKNKLLNIKGYDELMINTINTQVCPECGAKLNKDDSKEIRDDLKHPYKINYSIVALGILLFNVFVYFIFVTLDSESLNFYVRYYGIIFLIDAVFFAGLHFYLRNNENYPF